MVSSCRITGVVTQARRRVGRSNDPMVDRVHLLLDYDGTLVPFAATPELAIPDKPLLELLAALAASPRIDVAIVSGRTRDSLDGWFGHLPVALWAEHGFWFRGVDGPGWHPLPNVDVECLRRCVPIVERFAAGTPGAQVEFKTASIAWHYRRTADEIATARSQELRQCLSGELRDDLEILEGNKVIEVRVRGVSKAAMANRLTDGAARAAVMAFGDDATDEELFAALGPSAMTVAVGRRLRGARHFLEDWRAVRHVLATLLTGTTDLPLDHEPG